MGWKQTYNPDYHDDWAWSLASKGATDQEIADAFNVSVRTINRWKGHVSFRKKLETGKELADAKVEASLYNRCLGFDVEEEERTVDVDSDGTPKISKITTRKKRIAPDTMAIMYWLNNRSKRSGVWAQKQDVNVSFDEGKKGIVIYLPAKETDEDE
jgi:hypothetical protein